MTPHTGDHPSTIHYMTTSPHIPIEALTGDQPIMIHSHSHTEATPHTLPTWTPNMPDQLPPPPILPQPPPRSSLNPQARRRLPHIMTLQHPLLLTHHMSLQSEELMLIMIHSTQDRTHHTTLHTIELLEVTCPHTPVTSSPTEVSKLH